MSYRLRLYKLDKETTSKLQNCSSYEEYLEIAKEYAQKNDKKLNFDEPYEEGGTPRCQLFDLCTEIYNFGSAYNNAEELYKHGDALFQNIDMRKEFYEEKPIILDKSGLLCAIEYNRNCVIKEMEDLLSETSSCSLDKRSQFDRMKDYIYSKHQEWTAFKEWGEQLNVYNINPDSDNIVGSWYFEYQIFELVRIYKTFDWESNDMLLFGW